MSIKKLRMNIFGRTSITTFVLVVMLFLIPVIYFIPEPPVKATGDEDPNAYYGTLLETTLADTLFCPRFEQSTDWDTKISIFNPDDSNTATMDINYYEEDGDFIKTQSSVSISPLNSLYFVPEDHDVYDQSGNIVIESDIDIVGSVLRIDDNSASSELLQHVSDTSAGDRELYCPKFIQEGDWETWICVYYYNDAGGGSINVDFDFYEIDGTFISTQTETLSVGETVYKKPLQWSVTDNYGNVEISASSVPSGGVLIGYTLRTDGDMTYSEPLPDSITDYAYSHYRVYDKTDNENHVTFDTEIVLQNPTASSITVDFDLFEEDGNPLGSEDVQISAHGTSTIEISEYVELTSGSVLGSLTLTCSSGDFIGYMAQLGDNGAGFSTELEIDQAYTLYSPDMRESTVEGLEYEGFHGCIYVFNADSTEMANIDGAFYESDGDLAGYFEDLDIPESASEPEVPPKDLLTDLQGGFILNENDLIVDGLSGIDINVITSDSCGNCPSADCKNDGVYNCDCSPNNNCDGSILCSEDGCQGYGCNTENCGNPTCKLSDNIDTRVEKCGGQGQTYVCSCGGEGTSQCACPQYCVFEDPACGDLEDYDCDCGHSDCNCVEPFCFLWGHPCDDDTATCDCGDAGCSPTYASCTFKCESQAPTPCGGTEKDCNFGSTYCSTVCVQATNLKICDYCGSCPSPVCPGHGVGQQSCDP